MMIVVVVAKLRKIVADGRSVISSNDLLSMTYKSADQNNYGQVALLWFTEISMDCYWHIRYIPDSI